MNRCLGVIRKVPTQNKAKRKDHIFNGATGLTIRTTTRMEVAGLSQPAMPEGRVTIKVFARAMQSNEDDLSCYNNFIAKHHLDRSAPR